MATGSEQYPRSEDEEMVKCPGCDLRLPKNDTDAQVAHMDAHHPGLIAQRLASKLP